MTIYSTNKLPNINYDFLIKSLIYKQLNQPIFRIHEFNSNSYLGTVLSKGINKLSEEFEKLLTNINMPFIIM